MMEYQSTMRIFNEKIKSLEAENKTLKSMIMTTINDGEKSRKDIQLRVTEVSSNFKNLEASNMKSLHKVSNDINNTQNQQKKILERLRK